LRNCTLKISNLSEILLLRTLHVSTFISPQQAWCIHTVASYTVLNELCRKSGLCRVQFRFHYSYRWMPLLCSAVCNVVQCGRTCARVWNMRISSSAIWKCQWSVNLCTKFEIIRIYKITKKRSGKLLLIRHLLHLMFFHTVHSPTNALLLNLEEFKIYIKIHINIAPTYFGLRPSSRSLYWAWLKLILKQSV
jgi:hypothetical protein